MTVHLTLNHQPTTSTRGTTLSALLAERGLLSQYIAVAISGQIIPRTAWETTTIVGGEDIIIIGAIKGG